MPRIYQAIPLNVSATIRLDEKASHHLARVLRAKVGEELVLFNGQGGEYSAVIAHIDKKGVDVKLNEFVSREAESPLQIELAQGLARGEKMDFIVQKAVELGVAKILPVMTERCNVRLDVQREEKRLQHWQAVVVSACEQCGRNRLPQLEATVSLPEWLPKVEADYKFVLSPHLQNEIVNVQTKAAALQELQNQAPKRQNQAPSLPANTRIVLLIGPEGGLSDQEVAAALAQGFLPLNLGPRILRTETASIAAIAALQARYGDLGQF
jgi:16S rRNA (uracil1498-N3)-methyltransferase